MVCIFYAFKSTSCCQEKPAEQVHLAMCPETPSLLSCLIKRECNHLVNPECSVSKERGFYLPANIFSQHFFSSSWQGPHFSHFFFRRLHHEFPMKLHKGKKALCCYNHCLYESQSFPSKSRIGKLVTVDEKAEVLNPDVAFQYLKRAYKKDGENILADPVMKIQQVVV